MATMRLSRTLLAGLLLVALSGCETRWRPYTPVDARVADPMRTYEAAIYVLHSRGYHVVENDERHLYVRVRSHLDNDVVIGPMYTAAVRISFLSFQVQPNGNLMVMADGYHVRDGNRVIHYKLDDERNELIEAIRQLALSGQMQPMAPPPPPAYPKG
jgi:hypothetical protein